MGDLSFPPPLTVLPVTVGDTRDSTGRLRHLRAWTARPGDASVAGLSRRVSKRRGGRCLGLSPAPPDARRQPPAAAGGLRGSRSHRRRSRSHRRRNSCGSARGLGVRQGLAGELGARGVAHGPDTGKPGTEGDGEAGLRGHVRGHVWGHLRGQLRGHLRGHVREHVQGALRSLRGPEPGQVTGSGCCRPAWPVIWERGTQGRGRATSVLCRRTEPQKELGTAGPLPESRAGPTAGRADPDAGQEGHLRRRSSRWDRRTRTRAPARPCAPRAETVSCARPPGARSAPARGRSPRRVSAPLSWPGRPRTPSRAAPPLSAPCRPPKERQASTILKKYSFLSNH